MATPRAVSAFHIVSRHRKHLKNRLRRSAFLVIGDTGEPIAWVPECDYGVKSIAYAGFPGIYPLVTLELTLYGWNLLYQQVKTVLPKPNGKPNKALTAWKKKTGQYWQERKKEKQKEAVKNEQLAE